MPTYTSPEQETTSSEAVEELSTVVTTEQDLDFQASTANYPNTSEYVGEIFDPSDMIEGATHHCFGDFKLFGDDSSSNNPISSFAGGIFHQFKLLKTNLGNNFELAKVKYLGTAGNAVADAREYFMEQSLLQMMDGINMPDYDPSSLTNQIEEMVEEAKIQDLDLNVPFLENGEYKIPLDTGFDLKEDFLNNQAEIIKNGAEKIKDYYSKNIPNLDEFLESGLELFSISDPHFPMRPGKNILAMIGVDRNFIDSFKSVSFEDFQIKNLHKDFIAVNFDALKLENLMLELSSVFDKYHKEIQGFDGQLLNLNFQNLSINMKGFLSNYKKFLNLNNLDLQNLKDSNFELGFDMETFELGYVLNYNPVGEFLNVGIDDLRAKMDSTIAKALINYRNILNSSLSGKDWMTFAKEYFAGEFSILFSKLSEVGAIGKKGLTQLQNEVGRFKDNLDSMPFKIPTDNLNFDSLRNDPKFKQMASDLLLQAKTMIGDQLLIYLPEILEKIDDLKSLYEMVLQKVSVKDLVDMMIEKYASKLNLPDFNEAKLRGIMKILDYEYLIDLLFKYVEDEIDKLLEMIAEKYEFAKDEIDAFITKLTESGIEVYSYLLHVKGELYDEAGNVITEYYNEANEAIESVENIITEQMDLFPDGDDIGAFYKTINEQGEETYKAVNTKIDGYLVEFYEGDLIAKLKELNIRTIPDIRKNFKLKDLFQKEAVKKIVRKILTQGLTEYSGVYMTFSPQTEHSSPITLAGLDTSSLKNDFINAFKSLDKDKILSSIDQFLKNMFAEQREKLNSGLEVEDLFKKFSEIPEIKMQLDKLELTKNKLLNTLPGFGIQDELKKTAANFQLPGLKDVNPSFDFSEFQFQSIDDIFGASIDDIGSSIREGIEKGLVDGFKSLIKDVVKSMSGDLPNLLGDLGFGELSMNDLLDATDGFNSNMFADLISQFLPEAESREDLKGAVEDMSQAVKPMEMIRIMRGQANRNDFENMRANIKDPLIKGAMTEQIFLDITAAASDFMDIRILEELEDAYGDEQATKSICDTYGISYYTEPARDALKQKYMDLDDDEVNAVIDDLVEDVKDSLVDAIGKLKDDHTDILPFTPDPCSFMPDPSDMEAMVFVNDMLFDSFFKPIQLEYSREASVFVDNFFVPKESEDYVGLYFKKYEYVFDGYEVDDSTGEWTPLTREIEEDGIYNSDFGNYYTGRNIPLYRLNSAGIYEEIDKSNSAYDSWLPKKNNQDEWFNEGTNMVYVKKSSRSLVPIPGLNEIFANPRANDITLQPVREMISTETDEGCPPVAEDSKIRFDFFSFVDEIR